MSEPEKLSQPDEIAAVGAPLLQESSKPTGNRTENLNGDLSNDYSGLRKGGYADGILSQVWNKYIKVQHLTIDSNTPIGKIIFKAPIHPKKCNSLVSYFMSPFTNWAGTMRIKVETISTAMMNIQLCAGWVGPEYNSAAIDSFTLEALSAIDSQATVVGGQVGAANEFMPFTANPQNYFVMDEFDENNPRGFGGWLLVWVKMPLVTTATANGPNTTTIHVDVHTCGAFVTTGINLTSKIFTGGVTPDPSPGGNIPAWALGDLATAKTVGANVAITNRSIRAYNGPTGDFCAMQIQYGKKDPFSYHASSVRGDICSALLVGTHPEFDWGHSDYGNVVVDGKNHFGTRLGKILEPGASYSNIPSVDNSGTNRGGLNGFLWDTSTNTIVVYHTDTAATSYQEINEMYSPKSFATSNTFLGCSLFPMISDEYFVCLFDDDDRYAFQTENMAKYFLMDSGRQIDDLKCYFLDLINPINNTQIARVRLCPDGMMYTNQLDLNVDLATGCVLEFYGEGSISDPIPSISAVLSDKSYLRKYKSAMRVTNKALQDQMLRELKYKYL